MVHVMGRRRGMVHVKGIVDVSVWQGILELLRRRDMRVFLVTFHHRNFKMLIEISTLLIRTFNLMYSGLKMEHQPVLIKRLNPRIL